MTTKSFIAVEVLQGLFRFRHRLLGSWGFAARFNTSFVSTNFLQDLTEIAMATLRIAEIQRCAKCTASSYLSVDRVYGMNRNYKK